jgi:hypothetical protein
MAHQQAEKSSCALQRFPLKRCEMFSGRSNKVLVRWDFTVILLTLSLAIAAPGVAVSASKSIKGNWGCYGQGVSGFANASPFPPISFGETIQLAADSNGNVTSGTIRFGDGEVCHLSVASGSTYSIDSTGLGDLKLKLTINTDVDADIGCSRFGANPAIDVKILLTSDGEQFFFTSSDDYLTSATGDTGFTGRDFIPISGQCVRQ